ncbi:MAG: DegT/DnrJ/EryC1/StrS aminotransferase [candidate division WS6 bacterium 34_10]|uniref:DegT/DnrJ/EryC1/StrS aminotransferase n=1 Tax=candidate division WS6 bacterium 34_10 TaxID=1641389 RepID=A0A124FX89_9BACT|nr:MAG: DegT/DnrJ/EryC1/StrS aminotransferase [candidate division WS6 bacterium 34_10]
MERIPLIKSTFYNEEDTKRKLCEFIEGAQFLSMRTECEKFEKAFSKKQERKYSVFVHNGSCANMLLIQSLINMKVFNQGDKIFVSNLTWPTNVMPLIQLGLIPVFLDVELETLNVSSEILKNGYKEHPDVKGLFLTNALGFCSDIEKIQEFCDEKEIVFIEDNCESLGSKYKGKRLGNFGLASTVSFFVGHHLSTIEGGMISTDDEELYERLKMSRSHGWTRNNSDDFKKKMRDENDIDDFYDIYAFYDLAFNFRSTEINGFIGNTQIKYWDEIVSKREENFKKFNEAIKKNDDIIDLKLDGMSIISNFGMPVIFKTKELFEKYKKAFVDDNIEIRPIIAGNIAEQPFMKDKKCFKTDLKNSEYISENGFYFGNNPEMNEEEITRIINLLSKN